jgi:hypothetical protein
VSTFDRKLRVELNALLCDSMAVPENLEKILFKLDEFTGGDGVRAARKALVTSIQMEMDATEATVAGLRVRLELFDGLPLPLHLLSRDVLADRVVPLLPVRCTASLLVSCKHFSSSGACEVSAAGAITCCPLLDKALYVYSSV